MGTKPDGAVAEMLETKPDGAVAETLGTKQDAVVAEMLGIKLDAVVAGGKKLDEPIGSTVEGRPLRKTSSLGRLSIRGYWILRAVCEWQLTLTMIRKTTITTGLEKCRLVSMGATSLSQSYGNASS